MGVVTRLEAAVRIAAGICANQYNDGRWDEVEIAEKAVELANALSVSCSEKYDDLTVADNLDEIGELLHGIEKALEAPK